MPIINVQLLIGRSDEQKENFITEVTKAVVGTLGVPAEAVRIILTEMRPEHYGVAGSSKAKQARDVAMEEA